MTKRIVKLHVNGRAARGRGRRFDCCCSTTCASTAGLTGTKRGCDGGECGACTVLIDGEPRLACITLAARCAGRRVETIEGLADDGRHERAAAAFHEKLGTQCGFCTPGMIMAAEGAAAAAIRARPRRRSAPRSSGNLCRCTGYVKIVEAVRGRGLERERGEPPMNARRR